MLRYLADENFDGRILRGLLRRLSALDVVRVQDVGLAGVPDEEILAWAADEDRVALTHDAATMAAAAWQRVADGLAMPGLIEVRLNRSFGATIEDLCLLAQAASAEEMGDRVLFLPL